MNAMQPVRSRSFAKRLRLFAGWLLLSAAADVPIGASAEETQPFAEELLVEEAAIVVDLDEAMSMREVRALKTDDLLVLENGQRREVARLEMIELEPRPTGARVFENVGTCSWTFVAYIDVALSEPRTAFNNSLALGQRAESLTEMGCVDVVVADPVPRTVVSRSRSPEYIGKILTDLAKTAREAWDRDGASSDWPGGAATSAEDVERQWDRLLTFTAGRYVPGPKVLFLISDGFTLPVADLQVLAGRDTGESSVPGRRRLADVVIDTAQTLSSYGWLTVPMPHVPGQTASPEPEPEDFERWRDLAEGRVGAAEERTVINFFGTTRAGRPTGDLDARLYEAYLLPRLAPLRALAEATAGDLVWDPRQLDDLLNDLRERRLLWFRTTEPHDGRIRRLTVRLARTDTHLAAPWWKRSSTPHLVAESRLRRVLSQEDLRQRLEVSADVVVAEVVALEGGSDFALRIRVRPVGFDGRVSIGHVRISVGAQGSAGEVWFEHRIDYHAPPLGGPWEYTLPLQRVEDAVRLAVGVEDLNLEEWGATVIKLEERVRDSRGGSS